MRLRPHSTKKFYKQIVVAGVTVLGIVAIPLSVQAASDTDTTTVNAIIGSTISISTTGTVNLNVTPVSGGSQTSAADTVTVSTNNAAGYALTLANSDATLTLVNGANTIAAHAGTQTTPTVLANNSWGYHVDGIGGFAADGDAESNVTSSTIEYAGVPANSSPNTIKTTATTASGDTTTVWFGVKADTTKPNGTYADTVTYTATTNP